MRHAIWLLAAAPLFSAGVDPALLALSPPNARMLAGIQVAQAQSTPIGQSLMGQIQLGPDADKVMAEAGFDPRRDLREILVANGEEALGANLSENTILLGRGTFRVDKIAAAAAANGAVATTYRGVRLMQAKSTGKGIAQDGCIAFLDSSTVLAGAPAAVKAAIDRHASSTNFSGALADRARQAAAGNDLWMITAASGSLAAAAGQLGPLGGILAKTVQFSAGLKIAPAQVTLSADILAQSPQDAQSMADVLRFAVQMAQANRQPGPQAPAGRSLADAAKISVMGSTMHLLVAVPEKDLEPLFALPASPKRLAAR